MRTGVRLAIDLGTRRIGVARSDAAGILALPVETVYRESGQELFRIADLVAAVSYTHLRAHETS